VIAGAYSWAPAGETFAGLDRVDNLFFGDPEKLQFLCFSKHFQLFF
jgi:hypothetical protein